MAGEKNVVREGGLSPFKSRCEKVNNNALIADITKHRGDE